MSSYNKKEIKKVVKLPITNLQTQKKMHIIDNIGSTIHSAQSTSRDTVLLNNKKHCNLKINDVKKNKDNTIDSSSKSAILNKCVHKKKLSNKLIISGNNTAVTCNITKNNHMSSSFNLNNTSILNNYKKSCYYTIQHETIENNNNIFNNEINNSNNIRVVCRFRPLNNKEKSMYNIPSDLYDDPSIYNECLNIDSNTRIINSNAICVSFKSKTEIDISTNATSSSDNKSKLSFTFDRIFNPMETQEDIYEVSAKPIINSVLEGFNGTILAYGQTSSGKTYTMSGVYDDEINEGIIPRAVSQIFEYIHIAEEHKEFVVSASMVEIYMEKLRDLLVTEGESINAINKNLNIREDKQGKVYIENIKEQYINNYNELIELMKVGFNNRIVSSTNMNDQSSRSHSLAIITIKVNNKKDCTSKVGRLYLVDLAGSEKISKTGVSGLSLEEAKTINKSLTSLGMVINALTDGKSSHIPYRESKLTRILSDSLGGNSKTSLIITCSPSSYNEAESVSTLRFGMRAKNIKNKPKVNKELSISQLNNIIEKLESSILLYKNKIFKLENFIIENNLEVPSEFSSCYELNSKNNLMLNNIKINDNYYKNSSETNSDKFIKENIYSTNTNNILNSVKDNKLDIKSLKTSDCDMIKLNSDSNINILDNIKLEDNLNIKNILPNNKLSRNTNKNIIECNEIKSTNNLQELNGNNTDVCSNIKKSMSFIEYSVGKSNIFN